MQVLLPLPPLPRSGRVRTMQLYFWCDPVDVVCIVVPVMVVSHVVEQFNPLWYLLSNSLRSNIRAQHLDVRGDGVIAKWQLPKILDVGICCNVGRRGCGRLIP